MGILEFVSVVAVCATVVACVGLLANGDMVFTIKHVQELPTCADVDIEAQQKMLDDIYEKDKSPTFDDVLRAVNEAFGGIENEDRH